MGFAELSKKTRTPYKHGVRATDGGINPDIR
jgi:hypothetical protein